MQKTDPAIFCGCLLPGSSLLFAVDLCVDSGFQCSIGDVGVVDGDLDVACCRMVPTRVDDRCCGRFVLLVCFVWWIVSIVCSAVCRATIGAPRCVLACPCTVERACHRGYAQISRLDLLDRETGAKPSVLPPRERKFAEDRTGW